MIIILLFFNIAIMIKFAVQGLARERADLQREVASLGRHSHQLQADLAAMCFSTATTPQVCPISELSQKLWTAF